jgi:hypothetical protein
MMQILQRETGRSHVLGTSCMQKKAMRILILHVPYAENSPGLILSNVSIVSFSLVNPVQIILIQGTTR